MHNYRIYQVDSITFEKTPRNTTIKDRNNQMVTIKQYFKDKYKVDLKDNEPLFVVKRQFKDDVLLPSSICYEASLPSSVTSNFHRMKNF